MNEEERELPESPPSDENLPVPATWDEVLVRAEEKSRETGEDIPPARQQRWSHWLKAALPLLVLLMYLIFKWYEGAFHQPRPREFDRPRDIASLSGVNPAKEDLELTRQTRDFLSQLEALRSRNQWRELIQAIQNQPEQAIREHPVVQALAAIAAVRLGERSVELERRLAQLEVTLAQEGKKYSDLVSEMKVARAKLMISRINHWEILKGKNSDILLGLLRDVPLTTESVQVRIQAAEMIESFADNLIEKADGLVRTDAVKVREARSLYQLALRLVVKPDKWLELVPVSQAAHQIVERVEQKMKRANRMIHGPSLPFTQSDSETWTGKAGDPIHDYPPR